MRIRTIKPEFFIDPDIFDAEKDTGLPLRVAYIGLWCVADRDGYFMWEPRKIGAQVLPYDMVDFSRVLDALGTRGFIIRYASQPTDIGHIPTFTKHQVINNRETPSNIKNQAQNLTRATRVPHACPTELQDCKAEGKGREGKGKEGSSDASLPADKPPKSKIIYPTLEEAIEYFKEMKATSSAVEFFNHYQSVGWKKNTGSKIVDWKAAAAGWESRSIKFKQHNQGQQPLQQFLPATNEQLEAARKVGW